MSAALSGFPSHSRRLLGYRRRRSSDISPGGSALASQVRGRVWECWEPSVPAARDSSHTRRMRKVGGKSSYGSRRLLKDPDALAVCIEADVHQRVRDSTAARSPVSMRDEPLRVGLVRAAARRPTGSTRTTPLGSEIRLTCFRYDPGAQRLNRALEAALLLTAHRRYSITGSRAGTSCAGQPHSACLGRAAGVCRRNAGSRPASSAPA